MNLSKLPTRFHSLVGDVTVTHDPELNEKEGCLGRAHKYGGREIQVDTSMDEDTQNCAFWHEVLHLFLWDSGCHYFIPKKCEETLCDAFGSFMAGAMKKGHINLPNHTSREDF